MLRRQYRRCPPQRVNWMCRKIYWLQTIASKERWNTLQTMCLVKEECPPQKEVSEIKFHCADNQHPFTRSIFCKQQFSSSFSGERLTKSKAKSKPILWARGIELHACRDDRALGLCAKVRTVYEPYGASVGRKEFLPAKKGIFSQERFWTLAVCSRSSAMRSWYCAGGI